MAWMASNWIFLIHTSTEAGVRFSDNLSELPEAAPVESCPTESVRMAAE